MSTPALTLADDTSAGVGLRRALVLGTCTAVTFLYAMTVTVANVSLPQMQGALSATQDQIAWVLTANLAATAVATPLAGWLVSRFGRRNLCSGCVFAFGAASLACGLADSLEQLVLFRALQGAFGAPLAPASQAIILETYPRRQHGAVIAIYGMGSVLGPIVGPVVGGYLSETYDWRYVFYMMVPLQRGGARRYLVLHPRSRVPAQGAARLAGLPRSSRRRSRACRSCSTAASAPTGSTPPRSSSTPRSP